MNTVSAPNTAPKDYKLLKCSAVRIPEKMNGKTEKLILDGLRDDWNPDQFSGRLKYQVISITH
ncbi:MAG: hypothetical protein LBB21_01545 [Holosporaceae bacterium]|nr:hypothetical protein [Holosporaceae bacterium]